MNTTELLKKIRKIEIKTRSLSQQIFAGQYHSAFKGRGMAFSEVRAYTYGDDVRFIDWNVTARFKQPYVKVFEEERELTVMLLIDISASTLFGTQSQFKQDLIAELAAVLSFSAITNNDKVGVIFFSDKVEKFIPPKKGKSHILMIISELLNFKPQSKTTNISLALQYLTNAIKKKCTTFIISDFIDTDFKQALRIAGNKHDITALQVRDKGEYFLPNIGFVQIKDAESGKIHLINTSDKHLQKNCQTWWNDNEHTLNDIFRQTNTDIVRLYTDEDYVPKLKEFFKKRS
ncbi:MAG: DUF58 domain-containing protein [Bacteroidales bacterium]|nr:DUF58 domain-containing protein [Bacteroidales bacterium]